MTIAELKELARHAARRTAPTEFSVENVDAALADEFNRMTSSINEFMRNKYDIFEKIEAEKLKWACNALRYFAYTNGFNLLFHSTKDTKLTNILYSTVTHFAFNQSKIENINKYIQKNELRPLYLQYYNDSIEEIGDPKVMQRGGADSNLLWRESYESLFSKKNDAEFEDEEADETFEIEVDKKNWDLYKETRIDNELKIFEKEKQKQNKFN